MVTITQDMRFCSFTSPLGKDALLLRWMRASERVSAMSSASIGLLSERDDIDPHEIVGKGSTVAIETASGEPRYLHGIVTRFMQGGRSARLVEYQLELRPWLWLLTRRSNCRIFQKKTVKQILEKVFADAKQVNFEFELQGSYEERNYCVQYRETDFQFISRLLEDEGIFYYVRHEAERHVVVFVDTPASVPDCPGQADVDYHAAVGQVGRDVVASWTSSQEMHPGKVALKDYNFEDPSNALLVSLPTGDSIGDNSSHEVYDYHPELYPETGKGQPIAKVRMEQRETVGIRSQGQGTCRSFAAGHAFTLKEHFRSDVNGKRYMLLSVEHSLSQPSDLYSGGGGEATYENSFVCVPADLPYRPERSTPKPFVRGPQTAIVVGPEGEEIHVDEYGRIKVQFHWDREGEMDDNSSCWIRVSQAWAGKKWGALAHPRIGDEVIVECLEGDPDKPIVTGCVYNAQQMPPYDLPGNKTQSGLKSRSSPGGSPSNFNELRFEDKKGEEEVFIQAEKNKTVNVKNDRSETVGNDETISIGNNRTETVGNDETITIGNNRTETVQNNEVITVNGNRVETVAKQEKVTVQQNRSHNVSQNDMHDVGQNHKVSVGQTQATKIGSNQSTTVAKASNEMVGLAKLTTVGAAYALTVGGGKNEAVGLASLEEVGLIKKIIAGSSIELICGSSSLKLDSGGKVTIKGTEFEFLSSGPTKITGDPIDLN